MWGPVFSSSFPADYICGKNTLHRSNMETISLPGNHCNIRIWTNNIEAINCAKENCNNSRENGREVFLNILFKNNDVCRSLEKIHVHSGMNAKPNICTTRIFIIILINWIWYIWKYELSCLEYIQRFRILSGWHSILNPVSNKNKLYSRDYIYIKASFYIYSFYKYIYIYIYTEIETREKS